MTDQLQPGDRAPAFDLASDGDKNLILSDFQGKKVVLYFYPKDDTPGCTNQAKDFSALLDQFADSGAVVIGVSKDSLASHKKFRNKHDLTIALGSDPEGTTIEAYGAWVEKSMYGRVYMGIERSTVLIDGAGLVQKVWRKVKVPGHAQGVLTEIKGL
jgi:thioredoxin-dependent peroxiredoxin